jgi:hypothetical protein
LYKYKKKKKITHSEKKKKNVATTSWTASKSGKVIRTYTDGDHFTIAQSSTTLAGALELTRINLP